MKHADPSNRPAAFRARTQTAVLARVIGFANAVAMPFCGYAIYLDSPYISGLGIVVALSLLGLGLALALFMLADLSRPTS
ncbi:hypothetical protein [Roseospira navarrensis]|uniref:Uncharacterized protein n=1 Tax=Roseospira navarrensis TaxID=140058 RepID=A0A7X1ZCB6_9PROT|nr:hypothetical protein [Roseospira navarrensis]MQX35359.1 hypothetical protein [Roseospira navarrensis]